MNDYLDFTKINTCKNRCIFCFIDQLPKGLRNSLYLKDEDFRYSYLYGNFVTMTGLEQEDLEYIVDNNMSPLYISVHTTNPELRVKMLRNKNAGKIKKQIEFLTSNGISLHTQIVLCPEFNDGEELQRTLNDLYSYTPYIDSVGIVPFGATKYRDKLTVINPVTSEIAEKTLSTIKKFQKTAMEDFGVKWVYLADEFFLRMNRKIPGASYYDSYPQIENGIGLSRRFLDSAHRVFKRYSIDNSKTCYVICSTSAFKVLNMVKEKYKLNIDFLTVENDFFGKTVSVTGLLTGNDILMNIKDRAIKNNEILIPDIIFNQDDCTLDGMTRQSIMDSDPRIKIIGSKGKDLMNFFRG